MRESRIIGIFGCEQMDLCIYLAAILENLHYQVLVLDNSKEQEVKLCIPKPEEELDTVSYKNVDYGFLRPFAGNYPYDYVLVNLGDMPDLEWVDHCDYVICTLACDRYGLEVYREILMEMVVPTLVVVRDYCPTYMQVWAVAPYLKFDNAMIKKQLFLPLLERDVCMSALLQFEGYQSLKGISKSMEQVLIDILKLLAQKELAELQIALYRAKRGDFF